jgi:S1-C subfamily serine protease
MSKVNSAVSLAASIMMLLQCFTGSAHGSAQAFRVSNAVLASIVTISVADDGQARPVGSGVIVRSDGLILTAYHLVKDARRVQVRLANGETFDRAELIAGDERRNVAVIRIQASGLSPLLSYIVEEGLVGSRVLLVSNTSADTGAFATGVLSSVALADEIPGAGKGFRVLKFTAPVSANSVGGVLLDERERVLGLIAPLPEAQSQSYAIPMTNVIGLARSIAQTYPTTTLPASSTMPLPIPQTSVLVPERPVLPLEAKGPGSVVVKPVKPVDVLLASKTIFIRSETDFFKPQYLANALKKRAEMDQWGLTCVDDPRVADLVLTLDHVPLTWKFTFSLAHQRTGVIVATGNVIIWDGNLGANKMASRVIEKLTQVRAQAASKPEAPPQKN